MVIINVISIGIKNLQHVNFFEDSSLLPIVYILFDADLVKSRIH